MTPFRLPNTNNSLHFLLAVATQPFPLMHLPKDIRQKILEYIVAPTGFIGLQFDPWPRGVARPVPFSETRFTDALIALRSSCKQLYEEVGEVLFGTNTIIFESLESLNYLTRTLTPLSMSQIEAVTLTETAFYYSNNPTSSGMQATHTNSMINALNAMPNLTCVTMTMPWTISGTFFAQLVRFFATHIPELEELSIRRPDVEKLLPHNALVFSPGFQVVPGREADFLQGIVSTHPLSFVYPLNALELLAQDALFIAGIDTELGDRLDVHQTEHTLELARWLGSGEGWNWA